jgi:hypothetical protein
MCHGSETSEDETQAFSVPVTRLLLRHVPLTSKLSQDALDVIALVGGFSAYYVRTADGWKKYRVTKVPASIEENIRPADDPLDLIMKRAPINLDLDPRENQP